MKNVIRLSLIPLSLTALMVACSGKKESNSNQKTVLVKTKLSKNNTPHNNVGVGAEVAPSVIENLQTQLKSLKQFPSLTMVLVPKSNLQNTVKNLVAAGGKLIYDPNNGLGSEVPFIIAELTPDQINDTTFLESLNLKAASIDQKEGRVKPFTTPIYDVNDFTKNIPSDSVQIGSLGDKTKLGEGMTVAVIDTGIDASHPAFGDRVVYWYDGTQETRTKLTKIEDVSAEITLEGKTFKLPTSIAQGETYVAIFDEERFTTQLSSEQKKIGPFLDLNKSKSGDQYLVVLVKDAGMNKIYFDVDGDLKLASFTEAQSLLAFNDTTKSNRDLGFVEFPSRNNTIKYPILLEEDGDELFFGLGRVSGSHGTHVAGIIAADDQKNNLLGAAPKADLMALKVCSGLSCTDSAIVRGLYKAFYNGKVIPDVVNISLGSHEGYTKGVTSYLLNDLSAKFGTVFFISASNSGPGFRSLNHFGNSGAVVMVGANVSAKTLRDQYNLSDTLYTQTESNLFFSSLGPSYTGEMKPNIVAPGGAIAPIPYADAYMTQMNGTSMSSPLAAGTMAAILGKTKDNNPDLFIEIDNMRKYHVGGSTKAKGSLLPYVYAMRDALQNTAAEQAGMTRAQQGYGLIQAGKAQVELTKYLSEIKDGSRNYFEVVLNNYGEGYDRSGVEKEINTFALTLGHDGERTKDQQATIAEAGVSVSLDRVEILSSDATVKIVDRKAEMTKYFSIVDRGNDKNKKVSTKVAFINRRNSAFYSRRNYSAMNTGKSYLAHYVVKNAFGNIVQNILDVVHRPYKLEQRNILVPHISRTKIKTDAGFAASNIEIDVNKSHRYPIFVDKTVNELKVNVAIANEYTGMLYVQVYSPAGKKYKLEVAKASSISNFKAATISIPTITGGKTVTGIWEITVSTAASSWLSGSKYDLLIEAGKFGAKNSTYTTKVGDLLIIPVQSNGVKLDAIRTLNLRRVSTQVVDVKTGYTSFHPLAIPKNYTGMISVDVKGIWSSVHNQLYKKVGDDFVPYIGSVKATPRGFYVVMGPMEQVYYAFDTIKNYAGVQSASKVAVELTSSIKETYTLANIVENHAGTGVSTVTILPGKIKALEGTNDSARLTVVLVGGQLDSYELTTGEKLTNLGSAEQLSTFTLNIK